MRLGCLCVTENRSAVFGIGMSSFATQRPWSTASDAVLLVLNNGDDAEELKSYHRAMDRCRPQEISFFMRHRVGFFPPGKESLPRRLDHGVRVLFEDFACSVVLMWDDDDWSPPARLLATATAYEDWLSDRCHTPVFLAGRKNGGHFVNLRTLHGHPVSTPWGYWGASLAFNRAAWDAQKFGRLPFNAYDRRFVEKLSERGGIGADRTGIDDNCPAMVAFSHGKNIATWLTDSSVDMAEQLEAGMPEMVWREVKAAQAFLVSRRVFPPEVR